MRVGIHKEAGTGSLGGAEYSMCVLAEALSPAHEVEYITHHAWLTKDHLSRLFDTPLERVGLRYVPPQSCPRGQSWRPWRRYREARAWLAELSRPYDVFVSFTHGQEPPPFCQAPTGVLVVLFPLSERPNRSPYEKSSSGWGPLLKERAGRLYQEWEWRKRLHSYHVRTCNSCFTQRWTRSLWGLNTQVFYPPVDIDFRAADKGDHIVSVGRFSRLKKQLEMVTAFRRFEDLHEQRWQLFCAGVAGEAPEEQLYLEKVQNAAAGCPVHVLANVERLQLKNLYEGAKIFWHAAGFGEDENADPGIAEHFGIVTVEAMAAGCVPVVINKGGQPEIVQHGVNGFLWNTLEELGEHTRMLAKDDRLRTRMAEAARVRAQMFSRDNYVRRFQSLVPALRCGCSPR
jgi:glycosyltransferase involved in cell wall biosynthesis